MPEQARARWRFVGVVLRDLAADHDARSHVDGLEDGVGDRAADVIEIDVNAFGAKLGQPDVQIKSGVVL